MRGFRGSRAAQQFFGRHGHQQSVNHNGGFHNPQAQANASLVSRLPEWLKTPETKAREQQEAKQQQLGQPQAQKGVQKSEKKHLYDHPRTSVPPVAQQPKKPGQPQLRLISNPAPRPAAEKSAAPKAKSSLGIKTALKTKAKPAAAAKPRTRSARPKTAVAAKRKSA